MATIIQQLRTVTAGNAPLTLLPGQLALEITKGHCWYGDAGGTPRLLAASIQSSESQPPLSEHEFTDLWWKPSTRALYIYNSLTATWVLAGMPTTGGMFTGHIIVDITGTGVVFSTTTSGVSTIGLAVSGNATIGGNLVVTGTVTSAGGAPILPVPAGTIIMWAGLVNSIPEGYLHCNGAQLLQVDYPDLYAAIQNLYNATITPLGSFKIPDLRGMFPRFFSDSKSGDWSDPDRNDRLAHVENQGLIGSFPGEVVGSIQQGAILDHRHLMSNADIGNGDLDLGVDLTWNEGSPKQHESSPPVNTDDLDILEATSTENRPVNVMLVGLIKT